MYLLLYLIIVPKPSTTAATAAAAIVVEVIEKAQVKLSSLVPLVVRILQISTTINTQVHVSCSPHSKYTYAEAHN
jgi:hypothetical protein